jgi:ribose transport system substrate-binding protein
MRHFTLSIPFIASLLALSACGDSGPSDKEEVQKLRIAWVPKSLNNPVFETGRDGAFLRATELNSEPGNELEIEVIYDAPEASDAAEQAKVIDRLVADGIDGLGVSCNDTEVCGAAIDRAVAAGVEVMTWDSDAPDSKRFTYYSVDNEEGGRAAAELLGALLDGQGKVALISGVPTAANLEARRLGFEDELAKSYPDMEIVATVYGNDDPAMSAAKVEEVMAAHPDLKGWFFVGLWSLLETDPAKTKLWREAAESGSIKTVVFDTLAWQLDLLKEDKVQGLVGQKYWGWGYDSVTMLRDRILAKKQFEGFTNSGLDIVCANNVDQMAAMWTSNDFTQPLTPCSLLK